MSDESVNTAVVPWTPVDPEIQAQHWDGVSPICFPVGTVIKISTDPVSLRVVEGFDVCYKNCIRCRLRTFKPSCGGLVCAGVNRPDGKNVYVVRHDY